MTVISCYAGVTADQEIRRSRALHTILWELVANDTESSGGHRRSPDNPAELRDGAGV